MVDFIVKNTGTPVILGYWTALRQVKNIVLSDGRKVDWRWLRYNLQTELAAHGYYYGFFDTDDHTGEVATGGLFLEAQGTTPETYVHKYNWVPAPADIDKPLPASLLMVYLDTLPGRDWLADWEVLKNTSGRRRALVEKFESGETPFYFSTLQKFATVVGQALPASAQTRWEAAVNITIGTHNTDPNDTVAWWNTVWLPGTYVNHNSVTYVNSFDYALPSEEPGVSSVWDVVS